MTFTTAANAWKLVSDLRSIDKEFGAAEYKLKIADLTTALADLKMALTDARDEVEQRERDLSDLKKKLKFREEETTTHKGYRFRKGSVEQPVGLPFCPVCEQKSELFILTTHPTRPGRGCECPNWARASERYGVLS